MKKILLICTDSNSVVNFRGEFILFLKKRNIDIAVIASDKKREKEIIDLGVKFYCVPFSNRSKNPFSTFSLVKKFKRVIAKENPDVVFTFQLKPNIFGTIAAKLAGNNKVYCMIEGLGDPFQPSNFFGKIIRTLISAMYRFSLKFSNRVFVLNADDEKELVGRKIVKEDKLVLLNGIGIDTSKYVPDFSLKKEKVVSSFSRLIKNKGIIDYCEVARRTRDARPDIIFKLYGAEGQLKKADITDYIDDGSIIFEGYTKDVALAISSSRIICSCSYREGFPRVIMEAMALGRPVVASNVIGNNSVVSDGSTGYLVPLHDIDSFANSIINLIDNDDKILGMGKTARLECEKKYDSNKINSFIFEMINRPA